MVPQNWLRLNMCLEGPATWYKVGKITVNIRTIPVLPIARDMHDYAIVPALYLPLCPDKSILQSCLLVVHTLVLSYLVITLLLVSEHP